MTWPAAGADSLGEQLAGHGTDLLVLSLLAVSHELLSLFHSDLLLQLLDGVIALLEGTKELVLAFGSLNVGELQERWCFGQDVAGLLW